MAITDHDRKLLWGRSGNRCALCWTLLTVSATDADRDAIVGQECHIIPRSPRGPRGDGETAGSDAYENVILLCSVHHTQVDEQRHTYTAAVLRSLKAAHEAWIELATACTFGRARFTLPPTHRKNPYFTPKPDVAVALRSLAPGMNLVLCGPPGSGKTQHAVQHAHEQRDRYGMTLWASAESEQVLTHALLTLAELVLPSEQHYSCEEAKLTAFQEWLSTVPRWLLILDNADQPEVAASIDAFLPAAHHGSVIITSQLTQWPAGFLTRPIQAWTDEEAVLFLHQRFQSPTADPAPLAALAQDLGGLPLALEHAAAYITETKTTVLAYRDLLARERRHLFHRRHAGMTNYPESIASTWQVSLRRIGWLASHLLHYAACLGADPIPRSVLTYLDAAGENGTYSAFERRVLKRALEAPDAIDRALADLARYSLIALSEEVFQVHPTLQSVLLDTAVLRRWELRYWHCRVWKISGADPTQGAPMWLYRTASLLNTDGVLPIDHRNEAATFAMRPFFGHLQALSAKTTALAPHLADERTVFVHGVVPLQNLLRFYQERFDQYSTGAALLRGILEENVQRSPRLQKETTWLLQHFEEFYRQVVARQEGGGALATILRWLATGFKTDARYELYHFLNILAREYAEFGEPAIATRLYHLYQAHAADDPAAPAHEAMCACLHEAVALRLPFTRDKRRAMLERVLGWYAEHDDGMTYNSIVAYRGLYQYVLLADTPEQRAMAVVWIRRVLPNACKSLAWGYDYALALTEEYVRLVGDDERSETLRLCEETLSYAARSRKLHRMHPGTLWKLRGDMLRNRGHAAAAARSYARCLRLELRYDTPTPARQIELHAIIGAMYLQATASAAARPHLLKAQELLTVHGPQDAAQADLIAAIPLALAQHEKMGWSDERS